jgi:transposase
MKPLSLDLRERVLDALQSGQTRQQVAARFCVSPSSVQRLKKQWTEHQHLEPKPIPGRQRAIQEDQAAELKEMLATQNDWTLESLARAWEQHSGKGLSTSALHRNLHWLGYCYKKRVASPPSAIRKSVLLSHKPSSR